MTMLSFKQVESNYYQREPCERGCSWIIKFSHCLNFGYRQYGVFFQFKLKMAVHAARMKEKMCQVNSFWYFLKKNFTLMFFQEELALWSNGLVVKVLDSKSRGLRFKTTGLLQGWLSLSSFQGRSKEHQEMLVTEL